VRVEGISSSKPLIFRGGQLALMLGTQGGPEVAKTAMFGGVFPVPGWCFFINPNPFRASHFLRK